MKIFNTPDNKNQRRTLRNSATPHELKLWSRLKHDQLGVRFRRQYGIGSYIVDFYCPVKKLVIELDGSQHFDDTAVEYDRGRTQFLESHECAILRFTNADINSNLDGVLLKISSILHSPPKSPSQREWGSNK